MTTLMSAVAQSHALESSCPIVQREFLLWPEENRRLFSGIEKNVSPDFGDVRRVLCNRGRFLEGAGDEFMVRVSLSRRRQERAPQDIRTIIYESTKREIDPRLDPRCR